MTREEAQKLLDAKCTQFEKGLIVSLERGPRPSKAPTGEDYVVITSGGTVTTAATAIAAWEEQFGTYATRFDPLPDELPYVLYWRVPPEIDTFKGEWRVYSRCLISNKPRLSHPSPFPTI